MTWWPRLVGRRRLEAELDAELRDHVERLVAEHRKAGLTEDEARRRAALEFGGVEQAKEYCRDARGTRWLDDLAQDLRFGGRMLAKAPGFTGVALLSLALGIGANTAVFSLVNSLLLRSLPVREPERLVLVSGEWTNPIWEQIRDRQSEAFEAAMAWSDEHVQFDLAQGGEAELVDGIWASGAFFDVLGVPAILGRTFVAADDRRGGGPDGAVAVISYGFWQRRFGGAGDVIGRSLTLNRVPFTIVGVTPPGFFGPSVGRAFDVAVPIASESLVRGTESWLDNRSAWWMKIMARLKPGQDAAEAAQALRAVQPQVREATLPKGLAGERLARYLGQPFTVSPAASGTSALRERYREPLLAILAVVALVLLIACANIANLVTARAESRRHELGMRLALGASRLRLARQLLTEGLLLATLGGALGLVFAHWGRRLLVRQLSTPGSATFLDLSLDGTVLAFTAGLAVLTAVLFSVAPAVRAARVGLDDSLKSSGRAPGAGRGRLGQPLVAAQVALSLVLVVAAGLFVRTFSLLATRSLGFDRDRVLIVSIDREVRRSGVPPEGRVALFERARDAVAAVPGVAEAAVSTLTPVSGMGWNDAVEVPGGPELAGRDRLVWFNAVTPRWFGTYGTAVLAGRDFDTRDRAGAPPVAIVNQAFVRKHLGGAAALGRTVRREGRPDRASPALEIVGVVQDAAYRSMREELPPTVYVPLGQSDTIAPFASISVRAASGSPALLTRSVAAALKAVDPHVSLTFRALDDEIDGALVRERLVALLSSFFGVLGLLLAGIGLYGVTAYSVNRRRAEIGIRMALGADARGVVRLVLSRVAALVAVGIAIGTLMSLWASRFVAALLYGMEPRDPLTVMGAAALLAAIAAVAGWLPARRAARIDPARVLREG